jgi:hypothetical protein
MFLGGIRIALVLILLWNVVQMIFVPENDFPDILGPDTATGVEKPPLLFWATNRCRQKCETSKSLGLIKRACTESAASLDMPRIPASSGALKPATYGRIKTSQ